MSTQPKTIDDINRTKVLLDKTERIPGRDDVGDFKITFQNLQDSLTTTVEIGTIIMYAKSTAPANYLICNGAAISRTTYASLFAVIGTVYGVGDGSTTFNLPDYRAVSPKGVGNQTINTRVKTGPASLGSVLEDQMQKITGEITSAYSVAAIYPFRDAAVVSGAIYKKGAATTGRAWGASDSSYNDVTSMGFDSSLSPGARVSSTTDGQTQDCTIGTNFCIRYA